MQVSGAIDVFSERFFGLSPGAGAGGCAVAAPVGASNAFLALALARRGAPRTVLAVADGIPAAERLADDLQILSGESGADVLEYPADDGDDGRIAAQGARGRTVAAIVSPSGSERPRVVVAPLAALGLPVPSDCLETFKAVPGAAQYGETAAYIRNAGYKRTVVVESEGEWSARGGIIDAWCPGEPFPVRLDFDGDILERAKSFDPASQRSLETLPHAMLRKVAPDGGAGDAKLCDFLPPGTALLAPAAAKDALDGSLAKIGTAVWYGEPAPPGVPVSPFLPRALPGFGELDPARAHHPELFEEARARLARHLEAAAAKGEPVLAADALSGGFELAPDGDFRGLIAVAKADRVFTRRAVRVPRRVSARGRRIGSFEELEPGELVVHAHYGVGRFLGSSQISLAGSAVEAYTVEYADGAKLHVPADHAHLLTRYVGVKGRDAVLSRLDGKKWSNDRAKAEKAVEDLAAALLDTQAKRETLPGFACDTDCEGKEAFYAAFPYEETGDQLAAIRDVENDMASQKPMDRLVCGDAGYGKTEVAVRAAYIAAMNGRQTVLVAPTTILAEQHCETFLSRFDGTPVRIEPVSRLQTDGIRAGTLERIASGACDIAIGTHALLGEGIRFKNLGLVVIDEEQRFGVLQKERLKRLHPGVDVLTLSATPIPRTLYMALTGAKDLSLLQTPPARRVAVETQVVRESDEAIRAAVEAELARGGRVFCLHNRIASMPAVERRLRRLVPEARIAVAHGRMDAETLAARMRAFERGGANVLLSTAIVESGIDIPEANTIIVFDAQMFGLADLYQLRGRVGRSVRRGRALFLLPAGGGDSDARERLSALKRQGGSGAGFSIAMRDLELRGAGNLLGAKQSGHIAAVGFSLYCQLLRRAVARLKGEPPPDMLDVRLNLDFIDMSPAGGDRSGAAHAAIPYDYIEDLPLRMGVMKKLAETTTPDALKELFEEMEDRFGAPPAEARRLFAVAGLRIACAAAGIASIDAKGSRAWFRRPDDETPVAVCDLRTSSPDAKTAELRRQLARLRRDLPPRRG